MHDKLIVVFALMAMTLGGGVTVADRNVLQDAGTRVVVDVIQDLRLD